MSLTLLRHGATEAGGDRYCGSTDVALSAAGWAQMQAAVAGRGWDRVLSSPLRRCAAFAEAFARERGLPLRIDERLRELHFGDWEGRSAAELHEADPAALALFWSDPWAYPPPGAETLDSLRERVLAFWTQQRRLVGEGASLVVTHGGPIRVLLTQAEGRAWSRLLGIEVPHAALIELDRPSPPP